MQERSVRTRGEIVRAASEIFASGGYHAATISLIAKRAGVTSGALYFHFASKEEIARHIVEEQHRISTATGDEILSQGLSAVDTLTHISAALGSLILEDVIVRAGMSLSTETLLLHEVYRQPWFDWIQLVRQLLKKGIEEGDVRQDVDVDALAQLIGPAFSGVRMASDLLHGYSDLLERLRDLSVAMVPAFAVDSRRALLIQDAQSVFATHIERSRLVRTP